MSVSRFRRTTRPVLITGGDKQATGWRPPIGIELGLRQLKEWIASNHQASPAVRTGTDR
jgi:hypothetical protein